MSVLMIIIGFIVGIIFLLILVTFHEFAHFLMAKLAGAYVYEFSIGFGPKIFSWGKKETKYTLRIFPLGGYVFIASELSDPPKGRENEIVAKEQKMENIARWKRLIFIVSGAIMNFFLAVLIFTTAFAITGTKPNDMTYWGATYDSNGVAYKAFYNLPDKGKDNINLNINQVVILGYWISNDPLNDATNFFISPTSSLPSNSYKQQLLVTPNNNKGDKGKKLVVSNYKNYYQTVNNFIKNLKKAYNSSKNLKICFWFTTLDKNHKQTLRSSTNINNSNKYWSNTNGFFLSASEPLTISGSTYVIGIAPPTRIYTSTWQAYKAGWKESFSESVTILKSFGLLFTGQWANLSGPVGIAKTMSNIFTQGPLALFLYVAMLSANLFVLNLLPLPPLDGYKFFETIIEGLVYWSQLGFWSIIKVFNKKNSLQYNNKISKLDKNWQLPRKWKITVNIIGAVVFLLLFVGITIKDIFF